MATAAMAREMKLRNPETKSMPNYRNAVFSSKEWDAFPKTEAITAGNIVRKTKASISGFGACNAGEES
jgi:hypothetical protein